MKTVADLQQENAQLKARLEEKSDYIRRLEEWVAQLRHKQFSPSSEKSAAHQFVLFNEAEDAAADEAEAATPDEAAEAVTVSAHQRKARPRVSLPSICPAKK